MCLSQIPLIYVWLRYGKFRFLPNLHSDHIGRSFAAVSLDGFRGARRAVNVAFVKRAIAVKRMNFTVNVIKKIRDNRRVVAAVGSHFRGDDLLGSNVCRNVGFTPGSAFALSCL